MLRTPIFWILIASFLLRLFISLQPIEELVSKIIQDDAYYYFSIARNIAQGLGTTADGINLTNSFQPLWQFAIVPIFYFLGNYNTPIHISLLVSSVLDILTICILYKLGLKLLNRKAATLAAMLFGLNPLIIFSTLNGLEVAITTLSITLLLYYFTIFNEKGPKNLKEIFLLGLFSFIVVMSRFDALILVFLIMLLTFSKGFKIGITFSAIFLLFISGWMIWSYSNFGVLTPISGIATYEIYHGAFEKQPFTSTDAIEKISWNFVKSVGSIFHQLGVVALMPTALNILVVVLVSLSLLFSYNLMKKMKTFIFFAIGIIIFYSAYLWSVHIRYLTPLMPIVVLLVSNGIANFSHDRKIVFNAIFATFFIVLLAASLVQWNAGYYPWQNTALNEINWIKNSTEKTEILASFNSGILSYYSDRRVLNLDGIVNPNAIDHMRNKSVIKYMKSENVSLFVDGSFYNESVYTNYLDLGVDIDPLEDSISSGVLGEGKEDLILLKKSYSNYTHVTGKKTTLIFFIYRITAKTS